MGARIISASSPTLACKFIRQHKVFNIELASPGEGWEYPLRRPPRHTRRQVPRAITVDGGVKVRFYQRPPNAYRVQGTDGTLASYIDFLLLPFLSGSVSFTPKRMNNRCFACP